MSDFYKSHNIHPATPRRLVTALHKAKWNQRELARRLDVNSFYVSQLVGKGIEPTDATASGREVRVKLFLKERKPKPKIQKPPRLLKWFYQTKEAVEYVLKKREQVKELSHKTHLARRGKDVGEYSHVKGYK